MKQKLFTLFLALVASVGTTFAARDVVPSDAVLRNYYKTGQLCVCIFVPAEMACNDVVFVGTYNRDAYDAWITDVNKLAKFQPVEGYDGWYVIAVNDETPADYESKGIQGKPIVLDQDGAFNWQYQVSAATKIRGGVEIVSGAYAGEIDLIHYTKDAPNVYTIDALKGGNPCTAVYHNYTITVISDGCGGCAVPYLIGSMTDWGFQQMQVNVEKTQELGAPVYYYNFKCAEGMEYQVVSGLMGAEPAWSDESYLQKLVDDVWVRMPGVSGYNQLTGTEAEILIDVRAADLRWARCASDDSSIISGTCGDNLTWTLSIGTLTISGTGAMADYDITSAPWYYYGSSIRSVIISDGVTSIGEYAFWECSSLTSITIPNSVTSIGRGAFADCSSLTSVTIPNSVTSIGEQAFWECSSLTSITIPNSVTSIGYGAFYGCSSLTSITIPNSVTSIGNNAFEECSSLTSVILTALSEEEFCKGQGNSLLYSEGVRCQREIQINGTKVTKFTIPNGVTSIGARAFYYCSSLTSVTIGNSVTSIGGYAFGGCSNITSIRWNAKNCNSYNFGSQVTSFEFGDEVEVIPSSLCKGMEKLTSITIPNSVTSIGAYAFNGCESLTSITIPNSVTSIGSDAFEGTGIYANEDNWENDVLYINDCLISAKESISGAYTIKAGTRLIADGAFAGCSSLTSVTVEAETPPTIGNHVFYTRNYYDGNYEPLDITIYVPCGTIETYRSAWSEYASRIAYSPINIETKVNNEVAGKVVAPENMCDEMIVTAIPNRGYKFTKWSDGNTDNPRSLVLQEELSFTAIFDYALSGKCGKDSALTWMLDPASMALNITGKGALSENYTYGAFIESLTIGNEITSIGARAFYYCSSLTSVTIGNSVTSIGGYAFGGCESLKTVVLGSSVKVLEAAAFAYCSALETITCYSMRPPTVNQDALYGLDYSTIVYVPADYLNTYKMHDAWGLYDVRPLGATSAETEDVKITPSENEANVTWPAVSGAATYELVIKDKSGNIVCTLIFNANGQLTSIAFNAPSRNGAPAQTQNAGFSFTITGLDSGTGYDLTLTAKDNSGNTIEETTIPFHTDYPEGIENVHGDEVQSTKVIKNGQVFILRNGKTYTMQGQEVK